MGKKIAAFFDIDGTLTREALMIKHFKQLVKYEVIDESVWNEKIKPVYEAYDQRFKEYDSYLYLIAQIYKDKLKNINKYFNQYIAANVVDKNWNVVYKYTRNRIEYHKENGHLIFFISGSPDFLVEEMAKKYGITDYKGTTYLTDDNNNFTGELIQMWDSKSKRKQMLEFIDKYDIDIEKSYAYGDTSGDFSMLKKMKHGIAINPTKELLELIRNDEKAKNTVDIIVERKDVIYNLSPDVRILDI
ncbi:MAG: HAD-IB family hydrolase [Tissierellia bacterium]|nr:HAD-IB family hydrolase [Tissierellia bacterium]